MSQHNRRAFLRTSAFAAGAALVGTSTLADVTSGAAGQLHLACNQYPWLTFYRREGRDFQADLDASLAEVASTGVDGYEPLVESPETIEPLARLLRENELQMRSLYVNSKLHVAEETESSIASVLQIAGQAQEQLGTQIIVTNPSPIRWGGPENKSDDQLRVQAAALDRLGEKLAAKGLTLAYHNHDIELRMAAREFHHMMVATDPQHVTLCLDAHWIYRGSGDSSVALFDVIKLYGNRVTELHLRQSRRGVWTESFCEGDIDYVALAKHFTQLGIRPHLVLEQAVEKDTPATKTAVAAHRESREYASKVFAQFAS